MRRRCPSLCCTSRRTLRRCEEEVKGGAAEQADRGSQVQHMRDRPFRAAREIIDDLAIRRPRACQLGIVRGVDNGLLVARDHSGQRIEVGAPAGLSLPARLGHAPARRLRHTGAARLHCGIGLVPGRAGVRLSASASSMSAGAAGILRQATCRQHGVAAIIASRATSC